MTNYFPLVRGCLLGAVAAWTLIVLGIAIHFQMSFVDSAAELTYVSLAVFVAAVTLALFFVVLVAPCNRKVANILRTKWELLWLGILAILWTALAGYTTTPAAKDTEIECWEEDEDGNILEDNVEGYSDAVYRARYRVLQAFAFFNCILLVFLFLFILALAFWHHKRGRYVIWTTPTTAVGWFDKPTGHGTGRRLPEPVTSRKDKKKVYEEWDDEKQVGSGRKRGFNFEGSASAKDKLRAVEDGFKEKIRPITLKDTRKDSDHENLIQKPAAVARKETTRGPSGRPKQYVVAVPANEAVKPSLAPIAAKMAEERKKREGDASGSGPARQVSQRQKADEERQRARRDRTTDDERPTRNLDRQNSAPRVQRSNSTNAVPAVARRETSRARPDGVKREPSQTRVDVVRTGSGRKPVPTGTDVRRQGSGRESGNDTNASRGRQDTTNNYGSNNPYRNTPRRI